MQERHVKEQQIEHAKKILNIQEQLKANLAQVNKFYLGITMLHTLGFLWLSLSVFSVPL